MTQVRLDRIVAAAAYPGSEMVPAPAAILALLTLKLPDKERRSHIDDFNTDEALGLFAGLNILPKKSFVTDYSYRTTRENRLGLLRGWVPALGAALFPAAETFSLDFHPIPYRGDPTGLDQHYLPLRGSAGPNVQTFFELGGAINRSDTSTSRSSFAATMGRSARSPWTARAARSRRCP